MSAKPSLRSWLLPAGKFALLFAMLGATYALFAVGGLQVALKTREVSTPDVGGLSLEEAEVVLEEAGLTARVESLRLIDATIVAGRIADQDPSAGLSTRRRRIVKLWLSSGATSGYVPTLIGESEFGARQRLQETAFNLHLVSEIRSSRYPTDAVVSQDPPPDASGNKVSLLVNRGERGRTYVMPDLIGVNGTTAAETLRTRGFRVTVVGDHPYQGVPPGIVLRQSPPGGFQIAPGEPISLEVSQ